MKWTTGSETEMKAVAATGGTLPYSNCLVFVLGKEVLFVTHNTGALVKFNQLESSLITQAVRTRIAESLGCFRNWVIDGLGKAAIPLC